MKIKPCLSRALVALAVASTACTIQASPVTWTVNNLYTADPAALEVTGSFAFDSATQQFSNIDIITQAGNTLPGATYSATAAGASASSLLFFAAGGSVSDVFLLDLNASLPALGGDLFSSAVADAAEWTCSGSTYCGFGSAQMQVFRLIGASSDTPMLVASQGKVPEPTSLALLSAALLAAVGVRRRKSAGPR